MSSVEKSGNFGKWKMCGQAWLTEKGDEGSKMLMESGRRMEMGEREIG